MKIYSLPTLCPKFINIISIYTSKSTIQVYKTQQHILYGLNNNAMCLQENVMHTLPTKYMLNGSSQISDK